MEQIYLLLIILLFVIAIADLVVGVSNDAVNFLNSSIGSRVASRHVIMIVASIGIILGATFSSGIMEVARKGIFFPDQFLFEDVMIIFLAVMLTDIILLDLFNTFGMPTSTTVSIVFELLGASFAVAFLKLLRADEGLSQLGNYINTDSALAIIGSIFLSIVIAFLVGTFVQYVSRVLFTFEYRKNLKHIGIIWAGLALTALSYFLVIKGVKGASFMTEEGIGWFQRNAIIISCIAFGSWSLVFFLLHWFFKINILRVVVLFGTFSLAMAFAGNDLVNFIGVSIAGLESFKEWSASGLRPDQFYMTSLQQAVQTDTYLLLIAGVIMVLTLWFSKKARSVTETEVNLGRQEAGTERFKSNAFSRGIVSGAKIIGSGVSQLLPEKVLFKVNKSFNPIPTINPADAPAFDLVRASVNLTLASVLIALATSMSLPLSTTYVSFMVAMGSSLSDKAWGRDSAVYRVAGVSNVILGWLGTAVIAFMVSALFAYLMDQVGLVMVPVIAALALFAIIRSFRYHREQEKKKTLVDKLLADTKTIPKQQALKQITARVTENLKWIRHTYALSVQALLDEKKKPLKKSLKHFEEAKEKTDEFKANIIRLIRLIDHEDTGKIYLEIYGKEQDLMQSIELVITRSLDHVRNMHESLTKTQHHNLHELLEKMDTYFTQSIEHQDDWHKLNKMAETVVNFASGLTRKQVKEVRNGGSNKATQLFLDLTLESKDIVETTRDALYMLRENQ